MFRAGDRVHIQAIGTGTVREVRNGKRYLVEVKGGVIVVPAGQLSAAEPPRRHRSAAPRPTDPDAAELSRAPARPPAIDLHGMTAIEAVDALDRFLNEALLGGAATAVVIHGRSGGRLKAAVHARLARLPAVQGFRVDPRNPGQTIVSF